MLFDALCLAAAVQDCQLLAGYKITKINQPDKYTLMLRLYGPAGNRRLLLCANPQEGRLQLTEHNAENPAKPPMFCMALRKHLDNARLLTVRQVPGERIVKLDFAAHNEIGTPTARTLALEIMGKHSNILLLDTPNGQIIDACRRYTHNVSRHREVLPGLPYLAPPASPLPLWHSLPEEDFAARMLAGDLSLPPFKLLQSNFSGLSTQMAQEICCRAGLSQKDWPSSQELGLYELGRLFQQVQSMAELINAGGFQPVLLRPKNQPGGIWQSFYPLPLQSLADYQQQAFPSLSQALDAFYQARRDNQAFTAEHSRLAKVINREEQRLRKKIKLEEADLQAAGDAEKFKNAGDLLTAYLHLVQPGQKQAELPSFYDLDQTVKISLRPELSPAENARRYFHRYNKAKKAEKQITRQLELNRAEYEYLQSLNAALAEAEALADLQALELELQTAGYLRAQQGKKSSRNEAGNKSASQPRRYRTSDGFLLLLGRNNRQNDRLTTKLAAPEDIWLHTQKIPGSHVILKRETGRKFTETALAEAAALAAWHSQARQADKAPVDYTEVRNVKKPNGARPGMVIYFEQQTLYVKPQDLPPEPEL